MIKHVPDESLYIKDTDKPNGCWIWIGYMDGRGYGMYFDLDKKGYAAHKAMYLAYKGQYDESLDLDHKKEICNNKLCVNPDHLEPVCHIENVRRGKAAKLTKEDVEIIKFEVDSDTSRYKSKSIYELSKRYNVDIKCIRDILIGRTWKDIKPKVVQGIGKP